MRLLIPDQVSLLDLPYHCMEAWEADHRKVADCHEGQANSIDVAIARRVEGMLVVGHPFVLVQGMKCRHHKTMCGRTADVDDKLEHPYFEPCHQIDEACLGESKYCRTYQT